MNYKSIVKLACILLAARITSADVDIEKIKGKSLDLADLVKYTLEDKEPRLYGKIDQDEEGYFVRCCLPDDAIKVFANASGSGITKKGESRYVLVPLEKGGGIVASLKGDRLYIKKVANLEAYERSITPKPEVEAVETYEVPEETYVVPETLEESVEEVKEEARTVPEILEETKILEEPEMPSETLETEEAKKEITGSKTLKKKVEKSESTAYPDYSEAMAKIFEKYPALSHLIDNKVNDMEFSEEELRDYTSIEKVSRMKEGKLFTDYVFRSEKPNKDIKFIKNAFGVKKNLFKLSDRTWLRISKAGKKLIAIQKVER